MFQEPGSKKEVEMLTLEGELKTSVVVAEASTKAMTRAFITGTIPIIEFGLVVGFALLVASLPMKILRRLE